jgi:hypothetical protein
MNELTVVLGNLLSAPSLKMLFQPVRPKPSGKAGQEQRFARVDHFDPHFGRSFAIDRGRREKSVRHGQLAFCFAGRPPSILLLRRLSVVEFVRFTDTTISADPCHQCKVKIAKCKLEMTSVNGQRVCAEHGSGSSRALR